MIVKRLPAKTRARGKALLWLLLVGLIYSLAACTNSDTPATSFPIRPVAIISAPQNGTSFAVGQKVIITFTAADVTGIAQVGLSVDGQPIQVEKIDPTVNSFAGHTPWQPDKPGRHLIELRAINVNNKASDPAQVFVTVAGAAMGDETPIPISDTPPSTFTPAPIMAAVTLIPPNSGATPEIATGPTTDSPLVTARTNLNVRGGPGTDYPVIGRLVENQSLPITGRDAETTWWQVVYPPNSNERGWVSGNPQFTSASNTEGVPIALAPPKPAPTPPPVTPTPALPVITFFRADRETIDPGETVTLTWDLFGAKEAFLRYEDVMEGVAAPGSKTVSLKKTTVYILLARGQAGDTTVEVTVKVNTPTATPAPVINDGKSKILTGQTVDFDRGVIQGEAGAGADFLWDWQQKRFTPKNGASGAFMGDVFEEITLADCRSVTYGQPFPDVIRASRITGCYQTDQGRYGKFFITEWSADGSLTIQWLTWGFRE